MVLPGSGSPVSVISISSSSASSEPRQEQKVNNEVQDKDNKKVDEVIDVSSDSDEESNDVDSESDVEEDSELKLVVEEFREVLKKLERKVGKEKSLKNLNGGYSSQEPRCRKSSNKVHLSLSPLPSTSSRATQETEGERELKRKLEMVTAELSRSRMEHEQVKKIKKSTVQKSMVIEVPEYPLEYYDQMVDEPEYFEWIETRTSEFLPEVLKILTTVWKKSVPATYQLKGTDLLNCRLVSKYWMHSVDQVIQEPYQNLDSDNRELAIMIPTRARSTEYAKLWNLASGYSNLADSPDALKLHPFPSRSFIISTLPLKDVENIRVFSKASQLLLNIHGMDLYHFGYHGHDDVTCKFFDEAALPLLNTWITLRGWLANMPNLRSLQISLPPPADEEESSEHTSLIAQHPFPSFPNLVLFEGRHVPKFLMESVLSQNKTIEILECFQLAGKSHPKWEDMNDKLSKLSEFSMNVYKLSHILPLGQVNWPLRKLTLSSDETYEELIDLGLLFKTLESFQKTLQELNLKLWITCSRKDLSLKLPHLKKLDLFLMENWYEEEIPYDFLLPLSQLEMLKLVFEREQSESDKVGKLVQVIQLHGYLSRLYESNVWQLFPCLKKVDATAFDRDGCAKEFTYCRDKIPMQKMCAP